MQEAQFDSSRPATGADATTTLEDRQSTHNSLYLQNHAALIGAAYESHPQLWTEDADRLMMALSRRLHRFGGPTDSAAFVRWAERFVRKEADRYRITGEILHQHHSVIRDTIRKSLWTSAVDLAVEVEDIADEVAILIFERAHSLKKPGKAKLRTRVIALVRKHVYLYHNAPNANRLRIVRENPTHWRCDHLTAEELASNRAEQSECEGALVAVDFG